MNQHLHHHTEFPPERVASARSTSAVLCIPARNESERIGRTVEIAQHARELDIVDEVIVIDDRSTDGTGTIAKRRGATVLESERLLPEYGEVLGKGDAMWRALPSVDADLVCFVDADSADFDLHFICGLLGPLVCGEPVDFVKAFYRRPFRAGGVTLPEGGGRVTELLARPLLRAFYPELVAVRQPLAGEFAARRSLLDQVPFETGYGVEIGLLIDIVNRIGLDRVAQVDLDERINQHQPLGQLQPMSDAVLDAVLRRLTAEGRFLAEDQPLTPLRPPHAQRMRRGSIRERDA